MSDMKKTGFLLKRINSFIIFTFPSITNVVRRCALQLLMSKQKTLDKQTLKEALQWQHELYSSALPQGHNCDKTASMEERVTALLRQRALC